MKKNFFIIISIIIVVGIIVPVFAHQIINIEKTKDVVIEEFDEDTEILQIIPLVQRTADTLPVTILCYHEVAPTPTNEYTVSTEDFRNHIRELKKQGYNFLTASELKSIMDGKKTLPEKPVLITFDDGYLDNYTEAYPILLEEKATATFFVVSSNVGHDNRMTVEQLKQMKTNGMDIESHTVNHDILSKISLEQVETEFRKSQQDLQDMLGFPILAIAYPCGYASEDVIKIARKYYDLGFFANVDKSRTETPLTYNRYGVFKWNHSLNSIFKQPQK